MITLRPANTLVTTSNGLNESVRSFSNNSYYDPNHMGVNDLLVINDDTQHRFAKVMTHPHSNLEIISYQISGSTKHIDSLGNNVTNVAGNVYLMSTGKGMTHSEENATAADSHYVQIWFRPNVQNTDPTYSMQHFSSEQKTNTLLLLASATGPLEMKCSCKLSAGIFNQDYGTALDANKTYYLYVLSGSLSVNGTALGRRDAVKIEAETVLTLTNVVNCEVLFFEV